MTVINLRLPTCSATSLEGQNTTIFTSLENPNQTLSHGFDPSSYYKWVLLLNRIINTPVPDKIHKIWSDTVTWIIYLRLPTCSTTSLEVQNHTIFSLECQNQTLSHSFDPSRHVVLQMGNRRINKPGLDKRHQIWSDTVTWILNLRLPKCSTTSPQGQNHNIFTPL